MLKMAVPRVGLMSRVVYSRNLIMQQFAAVQTMENRVRPPLIVQQTKCRLMMQSLNAMKWVLDFAQKMKYLANCVAVREEAVITTSYGPRPPNLVCNHLH